MATKIHRLLLWFLIRLEHFSQWLGEFVGNIGGSTRKTKLDADFINSSEIIRRGRKGFCLDGRASLSLEDSYKGVLLCGKPGEGKTSCILVPSVLRMLGENSLIVHDPANEIAGLCSQPAYERGYNIRYVDFLNPAKGGFNPLARVRTLSDIKRVSSLIIFTSLGNSHSDPFWNLSAVALLSVLIEIVCAQPEEYRSMANVVRLLHAFSSDNAKAVDILVVKESAHNPNLMAAYKSLLSYDQKLLTSITATVKAATELFCDPQIALATAFDSVNFQKLRGGDKPTIVFINNSVADMRYLAPLTSIFFTQLMAHILRSVPKPEERSLFMLLDECSSLNLSGILQTATANLRKHRCGLLQTYQSIHQLTSTYNSDSKAIRDNCYITLLLSGQDGETSKEISALLGAYEYETESGATRRRQLLMPNEVRELQEALLLAGNKRASKISLHPFYKDPHLKRIVGSEPYYPPNQLPFDSPPLIPLS